MLFITFPPEFMKAGPIRHATLVLEEIRTDALTQSTVCCSLSLVSGGKQPTVWQRWVRQPQKIWLRGALFQVHLWSGIALGLYILMMSVTGSVLVYSNELYRAATPEPNRDVPGAVTTRIYNPFTHYGKTPECSRASSMRSNITMQLLISPPLTRRLLAATTLVLFAGSAAGQHYTQVNLVSNQTAQAVHQDPNLVNGWGIARSATTPWWISDNGTGKSTIYNGNTGNPGALVVAVPGAPTGIVYNGTSGFVIPGSGSAHFLFASEDGTISGWAISRGQATGDWQRGRTLQGQSD
jgi:PepSY-associated transmembrane protein